MQKMAYAVILEGRIIDGADRSEVKSNLARLFKANENKVDRLLNGKPVILKKGLSHAKAQAYLETIEKAGACCRVQASVAASSENGDQTAEPKPLRLKKEQESLLCSPVTVPFVTADPWGINFNRNDTIVIAYHNIVAVSAFAERKGASTQYGMLFFIKDLKRPYLADASRIRFQEFGIDSTTVINESLKNFVVYLRNKKADLVLDEYTDAFINGQSIHEIEITQLAHCTSVAKALAREFPPEAIETETVSEPDPAADEAHGSIRAAAVSSAPSTRPVPPVMQKKTPPTEEKKRKEVKQGKPEIEFKPFSWVEMAVVNFFAMLHVILVVGLWKAPVTIYGFFMSHIRIDGVPLRFTDGAIWLKAWACMLPFIINVVISIIVGEKGTVGVFLLCLLPVTFIPSIVSATVVFFHSFLANTIGPDGESPFRTPCKRPGLAGVIGYAIDHPLELLAILLSFLLINLIVVSPFGFVIFAKIAMRRLNVRNYTYDFAIPWFFTLKWCVFGYLSLFLGYIYFIELIYTKIMPKGKWVEIRNNTVYNPAR